jgi:hypothetical protein
VGTRNSPLVCCVALFLSVSLAGCESDDGFDQLCQDNYLAYGVLATVGFLWNQNLAGQPTGAQDVAVDCSLGGTAHVTGQTSIDDGSQINTVDLFFDLSGCGHSGSGYDLELTGVLHWVGTFSPSGFTAMTTSSDELAFDGAVGGSSDIEVGDTCEVSLSVQGGDNETATVDGEICDRSVGY